jgi:hypothetical protein
MNPSRCYGPRIAAEYERIIDLAIEAETGIRSPEEIKADPNNTIERMLIQEPERFTNEQIDAYFHFVEQVASRPDIPLKVCEICSLMPIDCFLETCPSPDPESIKFSMHLFVDSYVVGSTTGAAPVPPFRSTIVASYNSDE